MPSGRPRSPHRICFERNSAELRPVGQRIPHLLHRHFHPLSIQRVWDILDLDDLYELQQANVVSLRIRIRQQSPELQIRNGTKKKRQHSPFRHMPCRPAPRISSLTRLLSSSLHTPPSCSFTNRITRSSTTPASPLPTKLCPTARQSAIMWSLGAPGGPCWKHASITSYSSAEPKRTPPGFLFGEPGI